MADRLTQLQDAVDQASTYFQDMRHILINYQLATQFLASVHFINRHHELMTLSAKDSVRDTKKDDEDAPQEGIRDQYCWL
jgi:mediator of RNA polymerase II transcription subunit 21